MSEIQPLDYFGAGEAGEAIHKANRLVTELVHQAVKKDMVGRVFHEREIDKMIMATTGNFSDSTVDRYKKRMDVAGYIKPVPLMHDMGWQITEKAVEKYESVYGGGSDE